VCRSILRITGLLTGSGTCTGIRRHKADREDALKHVNEIKPRLRNEGTRPVQGRDVLQRKCTKIAHASPTLILGRTENSHR